MAMYTRDTGLGRARFANARRTGSIAIAVAAVAVSMTGCGSDDKGSTTAGNDASTSAASDSGSAGFAEQQKIVDTALKPSEKILVTTPLKAKPEAGKTMVYLNCDFPQCDQTKTAMEPAVKAAGWKFKSVNYKSADPATLVAAFKQALTLNPSGVALNGVPRAAWESVVPAYRKAKVPIVVSLAGKQQIDDTVVANVFNDEDIARDAEIVANWMAIDSKGKGKAVVMGVPDFPILGGFSTAFKAALKKACPGCSATVVNATIPQIGNPATANGLITSGLQKDPSAKYAITCDGQLNPGLPAALQGAGLTDVKIAGALAGKENVQQIAAGKESVFTGQNIGYMAWQMFDAVLRSDQGMPIEPGNGGEPRQLLTKDTIGEPADDIAFPVDYQGQFTKLWNAG